MKNVLIIKIISDFMDVERDYFSFETVYDLIKNNHLSKNHFLTENSQFFINISLYAQMTKFQNDLSLRVFNLFQWFLVQNTFVFYEKIVG